MKALSMDEIRALLPEVEELGPLMDGLLHASWPDEDRRWSTSGELDTVGQRRVEAETFDQVAPIVIKQVRDHLTRLYACTGQALRSLAADDPRGALDALLSAAQIEVEAGRRREAIAFVDAAIRLAVKLPTRALAIPALLQRARLARASGECGPAEFHYRQAGEIARDAGDPRSAATAAIGMGNVAVDRGLWTLARSRYDAAEEWIDQLPAEAPERWHLSLNRSIVAREEGRLDDAGGHLDQADASVGSTPDGSTVAILANARGQLLRERGREEEAEIAFRRALDAADSADARVTIGVNLARTLLALGHSLEAGEHARQAEATALSARVVPHLAEVYCILGEVAAARGHADAFVFFERALQVVGERALPEVERARVLEAYGLYEQRRGEEESGRARLEEAARIYDELGFGAARERIRAGLEQLGASSPPEGDTDDDRGD